MRPSRQIGRRPSGIASKAEFTSLSDRMSYLLALRVAIGAIVVALGGPAAGSARPPTRRHPRADGRATCSSRSSASRRGAGLGRFDYWILTGLLLVDGLYLAVAMYATGATAEPDPLPRVPPPRGGVTPRVVPDRPQDRAVALPAAVRRRLRRGRRPDRAGRRHARRRDRPSIACPSSTSRRSGCSRSRPRSSRRSTSANCASAERTCSRLVDVGTKLDSIADAVQQSDIVLQALVGRFGFPRGVLLGETDGRVVALATHGIPSAPDDRLRRRLDRPPGLGTARHPAGQATRPVARPASSRRSCRMPRTCWSRR